MTRRQASSVKPRSAGFTIVEIAVAMVLIGILTVAIARTQAVSLIATRTTETTTNQDIVTRSLAAYLLANGTLPCPADPGVIATDAQYGTARTACPGNAFSGASTDFQGFVPFRTLGIPENYIYDAFGNRLTYAVAPRAVTAGTLAAYCGTYTAGNTPGSTNALTVNDISGNALVTDAVIVLISHGRTGIGAFTPPPPPALGNAPATRVGTGGMTISTGKTENLNNDFVYTYARTSDTTPGSTFFDDVVQYQSKHALYYYLQTTGLLACT